MKEVSGPLRLQQILGHTSLEMVRRYVAMANVQRSLIAGAQQVSRNARRLQPPEGAPVRAAPPDAGRLRARPVLGGLHHEYEWVAA